MRDPRRSAGLGFPWLRELERKDRLDLAAVYSPEQPSFYQLFANRKERNLTSFAELAPLEIPAHPPAETISFLVPIPRESENRTSVAENRNIGARHPAGL